MLLFERSIAESSMTSVGTYRAHNNPNDAVKYLWPYLKYKADEFEQLIRKTCQLLAPESIPNPAVEAIHSRLAGDWGDGMDMVRELSSMWPAVLAAHNKRIASVNVGAIDYWPRAIGNPDAGIAHAVLTTVIPDTDDRFLQTRST